MSEPLDHSYEFGPFRLETPERRLLRAGCPISLTPKGFETLLALVRSSGHVVTKDDLMKRVWPDAIVEEANLARNIWALRKALGDDNGEPAYIETVPKLGYRFVAPVTALVGEPSAVVIQRRVIPQMVTGEVQTGDAPPVLPGARHRSGPFVLALLILVTAGLTSVGLGRFWRESTSTNADPAMAFLTDGSHDDVGASWANNGRIYFSRAVAERRIETWTMEADGSKPRRANTDIKRLLAGRWSPDGRKTIFTKEDDPPNTVYLADADGAHEIVLPFAAGNLDWSPDGSQFVYQARTSSATSQLFLYSVATGTNINLTTTPASDADPSFSPDGRRIAFTSWRDGNAEIYVMQADGSNVRRVTNHAAFDNYPVFSPDGTQLAFQSNREDEHVEIYLQNLDDDAPPVRLTRSNTQTGFAPKCWSPDGTQMLVYTNQNGKDQIAVLRVDPYPARLLVSDAGADLNFPRVSRDGRQLIYDARLPDRSLELRVTDLQTGRTRQLFRSEPGYPLAFHLAPAWSPDNTVIAFTARADGNSEIFSIKTDGTGLRNLTRSPLLDSSPVFSADGHEILFARDTFGQAQLYQMDPNGGGQRRVTDAPGYEMSPAASPDGRHLAFAGDRESRGLDILLLDLTRPRSETVLAARRAHDILPAFSPDGTHITFVANSDGNPEIYVMKADGTGLVRVTHSKDEETAPQFLKDNRHIVFSAKRAGKFALYQTDVR